MMPADVWRARHASVAAVGWQLKPPADPCAETERTYLTAYPNAMALRFTLSSNFLCGSIRKSA
jgi:hypothetical protein